LSAQHCSQMTLLVPLPSPTSFPTPTVDQNQTLFPAFLGAPTILTACFMAFPLSIYIPPCPSQCLHRSPLSLVTTVLAIPVVLLPFVLPHHYSCPLVAISFFLPHLSFSLSHRLVTILIVSIAMSPFSLCLWIFLSSHHLVTNLAILTFYCPCENQTRTTPNHNVPFQSRFGTCSMFWNGPWTSINCVLTRGETFLVTLVKNDEITKLG
jgi:hypothetical protein